MHIRTNKTRKEVLEIIHSMPSAVRGVTGDQHGFGDAYWSAFANSLFESIYEAAVVKSYGIEDELGIQWEDVSNETKAYHRPKLRTSLGLPPPTRDNLRPTLSAKEDAFWKKIYSWAIRKLRSQTASSRPPLLSLLNRRTHNAERDILVISKTIKQSAAKIAWSQVKEKLGAKTLIQLVENLDVRILSGSGELIESFKPTDTSPYVPGDNQKFEVSNGHLRIGSTLPYFARQHRKRPFWNRSWTVWHNKASSDAKRALRQRLKEVL